MAVTIEPKIRDEISFIPAPRIVFNASAPCYKAGYFSIVVASSR